EDHDHDDFLSFRVALGAVTDIAAFTENLARVALVHDVYRMKGFVHVPDKAMRHVIQGVGGRFNGYFDRPWGADEPRRSEIVVIGAKDMDAGAITAAMQG
ncbi:MAG: GTP-binding protein, partial [Alphaproteobacteria bacterium]